MHLKNHLRVSTRLLPFATCVLLGACSQNSFAQVDVLTYHYDNQRTGHNLSERTLTPANVNSANFGKLFTVPVDGKVDAEPLYVSNLRIGNQGNHNVVFTATEHDSVYAFNADTGAVYWKVSLLKTGETPSDPLACTQVIPEIGVTATPVISRRVGPNGTIYVVAMSKDAGGNYYQRIHALDLATGVEELNGPVDIQATYPGNGDSSNGTVDVFNPKQHEDRAALLLSNGVIYTSWTSHCDHKPYTGWTIGYNQWTLRQTSVFDFDANGSEGSIWGSGGGPVSDLFGNLYYQVANGTFDTTLNAQGFPSQGNYGNAFVKVTPQLWRQPNASLRPTDYWTMYNTVAESAQDVDLGSGGPMLFDVTDEFGRVHHLGTGAGKDKSIYVFDRGNMGKFNPANNSNIYQELPNVLNGKEYGSPAIFNNTVYYGSVDDELRAYRITGGKLAPLPYSTTQRVFPFPGTTPSVSADGTNNGIVWAFDNGTSGEDGMTPNAPAVLHAYDARDIGVELYNSNQAANGRDQFGIGNKFIVPTIVNGHVYVGTTDSVAVFGLLNSTAR